ncbi:MULTISPECIES: 30S ribosomal protein S9 [Spirosoma]|jgi:small subunit ribosomal protein S9|uniref:Small ribosomal subunit protein uS9 n=3 Tax=Spirosoma TaxID=107 RepID=A0A0E3ZY35_9BACT|nr:MULTISPECIES: 30S ribosomal protein S9 [Spirosoma]ADB40720.1 ribosomal protein S9 [Spirosoma linguale DSM 74]RYF72696.1 MAG: 30S ribosomal protein S9 [Cytophagaceae bacterium]AKD57219.1 30S ribosomal protein S9 [Spirosoma radiotolerans]MCX6214190.1 30S ribosomal protein S9 [Spirosoma sp.]SOD88815.1 SSU ribosomal protein S9P [Spirosoma fluviale]
MDRINTIGRRKTAISRIYMSAGSGAISVNGKDYKQYFPTEVLQIILNQPFATVNGVGGYDVKVNVRGGGVAGQAEATRMAIARALVEMNAEFRPALKKEGFLTRDSRMVERKKYGRRKARRRFQFSKR